MSWLKRKLVKWLLKDVDVEELTVRKLKIGDKTVTIDANSVTLPSLTADPTLAAGKVWYRCFPEGERIISNPCVKAVEELKEGDLVLRSDGSGFQRIVKIAEDDFDGLVYEIKPYCLPSIRVSYNHPILIIKPSIIYRGANGELHFDHPKLSHNFNTHKPEWVFPSGIRRGDVLLIPRFKAVRGNNLTIRQLKLLGLYLAEGTCYKYKVRFTFGYHEEKLARYTANLLYKVFRGKHVRATKRGRAIHVEIYGKDVADFFKRYCGSGAKDKYISLELLELPPNKLKYLLFGWALGDGYFQGDIVRITTTSEKLVYSTILALTKFGFIPRIYERDAQQSVIEGRTIRSGRSWDIRFPRKILDEKSWSNIKHSHQWHDRDYVYVQVREVTPIRYRGKVYHIQTEDGTIPVPFITHNSDLQRIRYSPDGVNVISIDPPLTAADVWTYSDRTLTQTKFPFWSAIITQQASTVDTVAGVTYVDIQPPAGETWLVFIMAHTGTVLGYNVGLLYADYDGTTQRYHSYPYWAYYSSAGYYPGRFGGLAFSPRILTNSLWGRIGFYQNYGAIACYYGYCGFKLSEPLWSPKRLTGTGKPFKLKTDLPLPDPIKPLDKYKAEILGLDPAKPDEYVLAVILEEDTPLAVDPATNFPVERKSAYVRADVLANLIVQFRKGTIDYVKAGYEPYLKKWKTEGIDFGIL